MTDPALNTKKYHLPKFETDEYKGWLHKGGSQSSLTANEKCIKQVFEV